MSELQRLQDEAEQARVELFRTILNGDANKKWAAKVKTLAARIIGMEDAIERAEKIAESSQEPVFVRVELPS